MSLLADVIKQCGTTILPEDCANDINGDCILKITLDCFQQMIASVANEQVGGRPEDTIFDFGSLAPYLVAHRVYSVDRETLVPSGLVPNKSKIPKGTPYWTEIQLGSVLRPKGIIALNRELNSYAKQVGSV